MKLKLLVISLLLPISLFLSGTLAAQDTVRAEISDTTVSDPIAAMAKDPHRATMLAAALPGMGQIYNEKYWKIPVVYTGFAALGVSVYYHSNNFNKFMTAYQDFTDGVPETNSYLDVVRGMDPEMYDPVLHPDTYIPSQAQWVREQLRNRIDYFKRYRDLSYIGVAAWYLISILDATVDASLSDWDIDEQLSLSIAPRQFASVAGPSYAFNLRVVKSF